MLKDASRQIECEYTKGYRVVKPEEFRASAQKQIKFGQRRMQRAARIIVHTPIGLLSEAEKKKTGDMGILLSQLLHFQKATWRKVKEIDKKTDQLLLDVGKALEIAD